jgi:hypothetical protein
VTRKTTQEVCRQAARLVVEEAIAMTPPIPGRKGFGKGNAGTNERTATGKHAVARDIRRVMIPFGSTKMLMKGKSRAARDLRKYMDAGKTEAINAVLKNANIEAEVYPTAQRWMHEDQRISGRIPKRGNRRFLIAKPGSITAYIAGRQKQVWKGVSGWNKAAAALKCRARYWPKAARKFSEPGHYKESPKSSEDVWFEFANKSAYMQKAGRERNIMFMAFQGVGEKLRKDLEVKLEMAVKKANL